MKEKILTAHIQAVRISSGAPDRNTIRKKECKSLKSKENVTT